MHKKHKHLLAALVSLTKSGGFTAQLMHFPLTAMWFITIKSAFGIMAQWIERLGLTALKEPTLLQQRVET